MLLKISQIDQIHFELFNLLEYQEIHKIQKNKRNVPSEITSDSNLQCDSQKKTAANQS